MTNARDRFGRFIKGKRYSPSTEFKKGQHWRKPQLFRDKDWLYNEYIIKKRTSYDIAKDFKVTGSAVIFWLKKHNISRRNTSQARKIKYWGQSRERNPMFGKKPRLGIRHSEEAKGKMRKAWVGRIVSEKTKAKLRGRKLSSETRQKMSNTAIKNGRVPPRMKGEKNPRWLGGKSFEPYTVDWTQTLKQSIRERDSYICQLCNKLLINKKCCVHHIDYNKTNNNLENLITLCNCCHTKTNFNREMWIERFKNREGSTV